MRNPHLRATTSSAAAVAAALVFCAAVFAHGGERFFIAEPTYVVPFIAIGLAVAALAVFVVRTRPRGAP